MNVIFRATNGINVSVQLSANARDVRPQLGPKLSIDDFPSVFCAEHHVDHILRVGVRHVPHLRCSAPYIPRAQRLRAGLKHVAPPALMSGGDTGSGYETCICIHAEQRAIAEAARRGIGINDSSLYVNLRPCLQCLVIAKAAGVRKIFYSGEEWTYPDRIERVYRSLSEQFDSFTRIGEQELHRGRPVRLARED